MSSSAKIQQYTKTNRLGLYFMGLIFFFVLGGFFALSPLYSQYKILKITLSNREEEFSRVNNFLSQIESLEKNYAALVDKAALMDKALPEFQGEELLTQLEKMSLESGVVLKSISIQAQEKAEKPIDALGLGGVQEESQAENQEDSSITQNLPYQVINVELEAIGDFNNFKSFLLKLEESLRIMDVISFSTASTQGGEESIPTYTLKIKTYALKKEAEVSPAEA